MLELVVSLLVVGVGEGVVEDGSAVEVADSELVVVAAVVSTGVELAPAFATDSDMMAIAELPAAIAVGGLGQCSRYEDKRSPTTSARSDDRSHRDLWLTSRIRESNR